MPVRWARLTIEPGNGAHAVETLKKAEERAGNGHSGSNAFFIAMSYWRLGDKDEARKWYDRAVDWMDKNQPNNEELRNFRSEATELMKKE